MSVRILTGDARQLLATLPDASVQTCVTSPPYFNLRNYQADGQIGLEENPAEYVAELVGVFREVRRVLRDDGTLWLNLGSSYATKPFAPWGIKPKDDLCMPHRVAFAMQLDGWYLRSPIVWAKPSCMPESVTDRPTSAHEHVFLLTKRSRYFYDATAVVEPAIEAEHCARYGGRYEGNNPNRMDAGRSNLGGGATTRNLRNVWTIATRPEGIGHFALMPPDLASICVRAGTSERGQCPHCASPWARVVERRSATDCGAAIGGDPARNDGGTRVRTPPGSLGGTVLATRRVGTDCWQPTCACPEHKPVPQTVLDPFGGAGTTGLVADRLGRNAILIELNLQYADLARDRLRGDCPMFAEVA